MAKGLSGEISEQIISLISGIHKKVVVSKRYDPKVNPLSPQLLIIRMLKLYGDMPISHIGKQLNISKPNMTVIIDKLISEGKVKRFPDKDDRRKIIISVTEKGRKFSKEGRKVVKEIIAENLSGLSESEKKDIHSSIIRLNSILTKNKVI